MRHSKLLAIICIIAIVFSHIFLVYGNVTQSEPVDHADAANIEFKLQKDYGSGFEDLQTADETIKVGDRLKLTYKWRLDLTRNSVASGDYIKIPLNFGSVFSSANQVSDQPLYANVEGLGSINIGTLNIDDSSIKIVYADLTQHNLTFVSGEVAIECSAQNSGSTAIDGTTYTVVEKTPSDTGSGSSSGGSGSGTVINEKILGKDPITEKDLIFSKNGRQYYKYQSDNDPSIRDLIFWNVRIGYDQYKKFYENVSGMSPVDGAFLVDTLPEGLSFEAAKGIKISTSVYAPMQLDTSKMSDSGLFDDLRITDFDMLQKQEGESYDDFLSKLKANCENNSKITAGVYDNRIIVYFGDIPGGAMPTYHGFFGGKEAFEQEVNNRVGSEINQAQANAIIAYCSENGPTEGKVTAFNVSYHTRVINGASGTFINKAQLFYGSSSAGGTADTVNFVGHYASASAGGGAQTTTAASTETTASSTETTASSTETTAETSNNTMPSTEIISAASTTETSETTAAAATTAATTAAATTAPTANETTVYITTTATAISTTTLFELDGEGVPLDGVTGTSATSNGLINLDIEVPLSLPYTAQSSAVWYIGAGLLIIALGIIFRRIAL